VTNPLADILPPKVRQAVYAVLFVAAVAYGAYEAADGDWLKFAGGVLVALTGALAHGNVDEDPAERL